MCFTPLPYITWRLIWDLKLREEILIYTKKGEKKKLLIQKKKIYKEIINKREKPYKNRKIMAEKEGPQAPVPQEGINPQNPPAGQNPQNPLQIKIHRISHSLKILFYQMLLKHWKYHISHH